VRLLCTADKIMKGINTFSSIATSWCLS